jgi:hypothetical protein
VEIASLPEEIEGVEETVSPKVPPRPDPTPVTRMGEESDTMLLNAGGADDAPSVEESTPELNSKTKESETDHIMPPPVERGRSFFGFGFASRRNFTRDDGFFSFSTGHGNDGSGRVSRRCDSAASFSHGHGNDGGGRSF